MTEPRRVLTGIGDDGQWHVLLDSVAPTTPAGFPYWLSWASDHPVTGDAHQDAEPSLFPPVGGVRVGFGEFPPDSAPAQPMSDADAAAAGAYMMLGNRIHDFDPTSGAHRSDTIDMIFIISGTIDIVVGEDNPVALYPGDTLILTGARHTWKNTGTAPARYGIVMLGAKAPTTPHEHR